MTDRNMGSRRRWEGVVVNRDDPEQAGRVQVRIYGIHDDKSNVPDDKLPWAKLATPPTSASNKEVGRSPTGITVGAKVAGYFADADQQIPVVTETKHAEATSKEGQKGHDVYKGARDKKTGGKDHNPILNKNIIKMAEEGMKSAKLPTIAQEALKDAPKLLQAIMKLDPQNLAGSIKNAVIGQMGLKGILSALGAMGQLQKTAQQLMSALPSATQSGQTINNSIQANADGHDAQAELLKKMSLNMETLKATVLAIGGQALLDQLSAQEGGLEKILEDLQEHTGQVAIDALHSPHGEQTTPTNASDNLSSGNQAQIAQTIMKQLMAAGGGLGQFEFMIENVVGQVESYANKLFSGQ